ncbi:uncharacterized protein EV422DRAFT_269307 [Fimicolochytrium jonesii]|uniref:uncharacterized protein n=1 Tax=Fimicolochytrium jonesii TaxID=1396493 RepID=UPI0022FE8FEE|nr:uncharacterized protein EV422DRAFT_269307 [Fimicolochytrium jonesii]KAI8816789.1 hypothetical protein EV422DRAFT_269307 [Fimicolochytrium jonesii]
MASELQDLFGKLRDSSEAAEYTTIIELADRILKLSKGDVDAFHAKIVALIRLEQYAKALDVLKVVPANLKKELIFEKAYCEYRANHLDESLATIQKNLPEATRVLGPGGARSLRHLEAQVLYRLEEYDECLDLYTILDKDATEEEQVELRANIAAVRAAAASAGVALAEEMDLDEPLDSYEMMYNTACKHIANGHLDDAVPLLDSAKAACRKSLVEEGYTEQEIAHELGIMDLQLAYIRQVQGKHTEAARLYDAVLKVPGNDMAVTAVASNNLAALKQSQDAHEAATLLKKGASSSGLQHKLNKSQRNVIALNNALLSLFMKKNRDARHRAKAVLEKSPNDENAHLLLAAITFQESKTPAKALEELKGYAKTLPDALGIHLAIAQLLIGQNDVSGALSALSPVVERSSSEHKYRPAVVSLLVWLYGQANEADKAVQVLQAASKFWQSESNTKHDPASLKQRANLKLRAQQPVEAAKDFEAIVKEDPSDLEAVAGLITAYSEFEPSLAEQYQTYLPANARSKPTDQDIEALEALTLSKAKKRSREGDTDGLRKIVKRKRKPILPKNFDPNVKPDPERWIPKRDRAAFARKGKGKKDIGRGSQGAALVGGGIGGTGSANIGGSARSSVTAKETPPPASPAVPPQPAPAGLSVGPAKKKKKGKK